MTTHLSRSASTVASALVVCASRVLGLALPLLVLLSGCTTLKHTAIDKLGDTLASGGTAFSGDDDPQLIASAAPFSLKMMESLLAERPQHRGLLLATASGFTQYGYAFVQMEADELDATDVAAASARRDRARRLYLRARDYGLRGLAVAHADFAQKLRADPLAAVKVCGRDDVPFLYWTAASWAAAISIKKDRPDLIADLPLMEALIDRALALDEAYDRGAIHNLLISYEMARSGAPGDPAERSRAHFERAVALGGGLEASPLISFAESVCVAKQDRTRFVALLREALAINLDARPESRLVNVIMQRRASRLLEHIDDLFLPAAEPETTASPNPVTTLP